MKCRWVLLIASLIEADSIAERAISGACGTIVVERDEETGIIQCSPDDVAVGLARLLVVQIVVVAGKWRPFGTWRAHSDGCACDWAEKQQGKNTVRAGNFQEM